MAREQEKDLQERVLLVGVDIGEEDFERSMEELVSLARASERCVVGVITQRLGSVNKTFYVGAGKVEEIAEYAREQEAQAIIFDNALSPSQVRNLSRRLALTVLDRTNLILDIFAIRARTREAKLQVEAARLQYLLPRLAGGYDSLSRQGGASGSMSNRGAGEKKLELDRRRIEHRIAELKKELEELAGSRRTQRKRRNESRIPQVALVGYTNAGKSTVLNRLVEHGGDGAGKLVLEKDMLFATLETSVRSIELGDNRPFFVVDTVGFIRKLPHGLIKAFRSTLEEVTYAELLVQVVDFSDPAHRLQMEVTEETLRELGAGDIPRITVYNKADKCGMSGLPRIRGRQIYMAAADDVGVRELAEMIQGIVYQNLVDGTFFIPYDKGGAASYLMENGTVRRQEYRADGVLLEVSCHRQDAARYARFQVSCEEKTR